MLLDSQFIYFSAPRETLTFGLTGEDDEDSDDMDDEDQAFLFG